MYAEIKSSDKIIINRLNDSERIILSDIFEKYSHLNSKVTLSPIMNEDAQFDGLFLNIIDGGKDKVELITPIPSSIYLTIGSNMDIEFNTNLKIEDTIILTYIDDNKSIDISTKNNVLSIYLGQNQELGSYTIYYTIQCNGYESYEGNITVNVIQKEKATVKISVLDDELLMEVENPSITIKDINDTSILPNDNNTYDLSIGEYTLTIEKEGYNTKITSFEIVSENLVESETIKTFNLTKSHI